MAALDGSSWNHTHQAAAKCSHPSSTNSIKQSSSTRERPVPLIALLLSLTAGDYSWRSKVLKVVQYAIKLQAWKLKLLEQNGSSRERWTGAAKHLSVARSLFTLGSSIGAVQDFIKHVKSTDDSKQEETDIVSNPRNIVDTVVEAIDTASDLIDDVNTLKKARILESHNLPFWFSRTVDISWALTCVIRLIESIEKAYNTKQNLVQTEQWYNECVRRKHDDTGNARTEQDDPESPNGYKHSITYAASQVHKCKQKHISAVLGLVKCVCDCGQSLPGALKLDVWTPEVFDIMCGLSSGILNVCKTIYDKQ